MGNGDIFTYRVSGADFLDRDIDDRFSEPGHFRVLINTKLLPRGIYR